MAISKWFHCLLTRLEYQIIYNVVVKTCVCTNCEQPMSSFEKKKKKKKKTTSISTRHRNRNLLKANDCKVVVKSMFAEIVSNQCKVSSN